MKEHFFVLDTFRGIAAICVVLFHMHYVGTITELSFFQHSDVFVEFFFVLSGFVLAHSYSSKPLNFKKFFIGRTFRLMPLHLFMFVVIFIIEIGKLIAYHKGIVFNNIPFQAHTDPKEILPNLLLLQTWFTDFNARSFNSPSWSISIEYYIYFIFFVTLMIKDKARFIVWAVFSFVSLYLIFLNINFSSDILRGLSSFFAGVISYHIYRNTNKKINISNGIFSLLEIAFLFILILLISNEFQYKSILIILFFATYINLFAFEKGILSHFFRNKIFNTIGKISYSIYLVHFALLFLFLATIIIMEKVLHIQLTSMISGERYVDLGHPLINNILLVGIITGIIMVSKFTYIHIEKKGQELGYYVLNTHPILNLKISFYTLSYFIKEKFHTFKTHKTGHAS